MSTTLRSFHDQLLAMKPEDAVHIASECPVCSDEDVEVASSTPNGGPSVTDTKTYEAEYNEAIAKVEALETKVAELSAAAEASTIDAKVAEVKAEAEAQVAEIQSKLDAAVLEAETAKSAHESLVAFLDETAKAEAEAAEFASRKDERIAAVKEAAPLLPDEYITENADRFANMDEEAFTASLEGFRAIAAKAPAAPSEIPATTAMTAARSNDGESAPNVLRDVLSLRSMGVDTRTIN
jgi:golgin subfamily B member 1